MAPNVLPDKRDIRCLSSPQWGHFTSSVGPGIIPKADFKDKIKTIDKRNINFLAMVNNNYETNINPIITKIII